MERLRETQSQQEEHRELRERALTERHALQMTRKKLLEHRLQTRDAEAKLVTELRQVCLKAKEPDYEVLFGLYQDVSNAQDVLGSLEEDYGAEEREYDVLEWQLGKLEADLVGDLLEDMEDLKIVPPEPTGSLSASDKRPIATAPVASTMEPFMSDPESASYPKVLEAPKLFNDPHLAHSWSASTTECSESCPNKALEDEELRNISGKSESQFTDHLNKVVEETTKALAEYPTPEPRRASEPVNSISHFLMVPEPAQRARSESGLSQILPRWPSTQAHVDQWISDSLRESHMEKVIAKAHSEEKIASAQSGATRIDRRAWWSLFKDFRVTGTPNERARSTNEAGENEREAFGASGIGNRSEGVHGALESPH